jgi:hypothetical protein
MGLPESTDDLTPDNPRRHIPNWTVTDPHEWAKKFAAWISYCLGEFTSHRFWENDYAEWFEMAIFSGKESYRLEKYPLKTGTLEEVIKGRRFAVLQRKSWTDKRIFVIYFDGNWNVKMGSDGSQITTLTKIEDILADDWEHVTLPA